MDNGGTSKLTAVRLRPPKPSLLWPWTRRALTQSPQTQNCNYASHVGGYTLAGFNGSRYGSLRKCPHRRRRDLGDAGAYIANEVIETGLQASADSIAFAVNDLLRSFVSQSASGNEKTTADRTSWSLVHDKVVPPSLEGSLACSKHLALKPATTLLPFGQRLLADDLDPHDRYSNANFQVNWRPMRDMTIKEVVRKIDGPKNVKPTVQYLSSLNGWRIVYQDKNVRRVLRERR